MEAITPPKPGTAWRRRRGRRIGRLYGNVSLSAVIPFLLLVLGFFALLLPSLCHGAAAGPFGGQKTKKQKPVVSLTSEELLDHLEEWNTDLAIFFYAPWCPYCK